VVDRPDPAGEVLIAAALSAAGMSAQEAARTSRRHQRGQVVASTSPNPAISMPAHAAVPALMSAAMRNNGLQVRLPRQLALLGLVPVRVYAGLGRSPTRRCWMSAIGAGLME
jgi:hypothetical protein